jgi:HlyD family secretion protein
MSVLKSTRFWGLIVLLLVLASGGVFLAKRRSAKPKVRWETTAVDRGRVVARVTATGTLSALVTVQVGTQVSGSLQKIYVDFNSPVKKGQIIAKIDPRLFQAALENARANYAQAKAALHKDEVQALLADRQFQRQGNLAKDKLIAPADFDTAESTAHAAAAQLEADRANVKQAQAILHQAEVNMALTNIVSPTDGVVISRNVDVGQTVAASLQAPVLFVIAEDLRKMQVDTSVAEADVGKLQAGMSATFAVDAFPNEWFKGTVRQIRNAATTLQNVVTYDAVIDVQNSDLRLRPGMTANVTFVVANKEDVLRVPNAALRFRPSSELAAALSLELPKGKRSGGEHASGAGSPARGSADGEEADRRTIWVLRGELPGSVRIRVGTSDGSKTEVVEGALQIGDLVISDATLPAELKAPAAKGLLPGAGPPPGGPRRL